MKFSIKDFFSKCDQFWSFLRIWSHLLRKSLMENFHFLCSVYCSVFCHFPTPSFLHSYNVHLKMIISFVLAYFECATAFIHSQFELKYVLQRYNYFCLFNPFVSNAPFLQPLKTSEKLTVF